MSATIFCTFDQQDLADLAMGRLRSEFSGINRITYSLGATHDYPSAAENSATYGTILTGMAPVMTTTGMAPSRPATVRISCDDAIKNQVVSRLVNLHAYRIITA